MKQVPWNKGIKGSQIAWNKGKIMSIEYRKKLSKAHLGQTAWNKGLKTGLIPKTVFKKGFTPWNKGMRTSKVTTSEYRKRYYYKHPGRVLTQNRIRAGKIKGANLDKTADMKKIEQFYILAENLTKNTGIKYSVDHIKPLIKGGLHHQDNLQVITLQENIIKGSKYPFEVKDAYLTE